VYSQLLLVIHVYISAPSGQFSRPFDVAVCPVTGRIMVADSDNSRVQVFDDVFRHIMDITQGGRGKRLQYPCGVTFSSVGEIIASDYRAHKVIIYRQDGQYIRQVTGSLRGPCGLSVDKDDNLYICNAYAYSVTVTDKAGVVLRSFGSYGTGPGQFSSAPLYVTIYKGHVLVSDNNTGLYEFTRTGSYRKMMCTGVLHNVRGLVVDRSGDLVVVHGRSVSILRGDNVVCRVGESGDKPWQLTYPRGVAVTNAGQIVVTDSNQHNLLVCDMTS
jgi:DNA-binding beta-propeller fold protein YncE